MLLAQSPCLMVLCVTYNLRPSNARSEESGSIGKAGRALNLCFYPPQQKKHHDPPQVKQLTDLSMPPLPVFNALQYNATGGCGARLLECSIGE